MVPTEELDPASSISDRDQIITLMGSHNDTIVGHFRETGPVQVYSTATQDTENRREAVHAAAAAAYTKNRKRAGDGAE